MPREVNKGWWLIACMIPFVIFASASKTNSHLGNTVKWRPPSKMYIVSWILICCCMSASWGTLVYSPSTENSRVFLGVMLVMFCVITGIATSWIFLYEHDKRYGIAVFLALLAVVGTVLPILYSANPISMGLMMPLVVWGVFQLCVNCAAIS